MKIYIHFLWLGLILLTACSDSTAQLNEDFGTPQVRDRIVKPTHALAHHFITEVNPILESRCVVCHGCYDAPCQLKLSSVEGIDRGFSPQEVYATRFTEIEPTRLLIDAKSTQAWRDKEFPFKPVLNERNQTPIANLQGSVLYQLLKQKNLHPSPATGTLPASFDFSLTRSQTCPSIETLADYQEDQPLAGMPYGLPAIDKSEFTVLKHWVEQGAPMAQPLALNQSIQQRVNSWEKILNGQSNKEKLINRYIYEHLFLGHIYFSEEVVKSGGLPVYFRLVRSTTPPGEPISEIASRRPYDDPKVKTVYYRLRRDTSTVLTKTHLPYALNAKRLTRWNELFYKKNFTVAFLPTYKNGSNPFTNFALLPAKSRYEFMLDEARFIIAGFIKGPSCRGQIALNVIQDKFWVFFSDPKYLASETYNNFIYQQSDNLELPSDFSVDNGVFESWSKYSKREVAYINAQNKLLKSIENSDTLIGLDSLWRGNDNAALSVFRHFDSAVVIKGLQGAQPKTAWVINYPILERIHYLLVAGFDIYSPVKHQLLSRLYMDFLRIESEIGFISLLPKEKRKEELDYWYRGSIKTLDNYLSGKHFLLKQKNSITYQSDNPKKELLDRLKALQLASLIKHNKKESITKDTVRILTKHVSKGSLSALNTLPNKAVQQLPQTSFILLSSADEGETQGFTLLRHNSHKNTSTLLLESNTRQPKLDDAEIYQGFIGSYPQTIFRLTHSELPQFIKQLSSVIDKTTYASLLERFAVRRTDPNFWQVSDQIHTLHKKLDPVSYGLFDYNRLENR